MDDAQQPTPAPTPRPAPAPAGAARRGPATLALLLPPGLALLLPLLAENSLIALGFLWAEPLWCALAAYLVLASLWEGRLALACSLFAGALGAVTLLHRPQAVGPVSPGAGAWGLGLRGCARLAPPPEAPVRVAQLARGPAPFADELAALLDSEAGVFVLYGFSASEATALAGAVQGEARHAEGQPSTRGLSVVVRGSFKPCAAAGDPPGEDLWQRPLPSTHDRGAVAALSFPMVRGGGVLPLLAFRLDQPGGAADWTAWPERQADGAAVLDELVDAIGARHLLVVGEAMAPSGRRRLFSGLASRGLRRVGLPWTWPGPQGAFGGLRLHPGEGAWTGSELEARGAGRLLRAPGQRDGVWVEVGAAGE